MYQVIITGFYYCCGRAIYKAEIFNGVIASKHLEDEIEAYCVGAFKQCSSNKIDSMLFDVKVYTSDTVICEWNKPIKVKYYRVITDIDNDICIDKIKEC